MSIKPRRGRALIVGASLSGLMSALALSRSGMDVVILERSDDSGRTGAALQAEPGMLARLTGRDDAFLRDAIPTGVQTWFAVHDGLRAAVERDGAIALHEHTQVDCVGQDEEGSWARTVDGSVFHADILIGADGHRSVVRRHVCPEKPDAVFAGYLIWIGIVNKSRLPPQTQWPTGLSILDAAGHTLLGCSLDYTAADQATGDRQLGWGWYDASRNMLLREQGCVADNVVQHSLKGDDIPDQTYAALARQARAKWPSPWREAILDCIARRAIIGTPIAEYVPDRLVKGRIALVGDAAHVPTPMTGNGFSASFKDALALAESITDCANSDYRQALQRYERNRLLEAQRLVRGGQQFSRSFAATAH